MKMARNSIIILTLVISIFNFGNARDLILSGSIADSVSGQAIPNVSVLVEGTTIGTTTDRNGYFKLPVAENLSQSFLLFQHVAYHQLRILINDLPSEAVIHLQIKNIPLPEMRVEAERKPFKYDQELTNIVSELTAEQFENKGFMDAADVLLSDQSILVNESTNGKKTISVRGSNEDEVIVLFNGIRINNNFNNQADLAMIDPNTLQQIDVIKGASSAIVGAYGSSAVINFIPKMEQDYLLKFQQRFGSNDAGDWNLNLYKNIFGCKVFSGFRQGASNQQYADQPGILAISNSFTSYLLNFERSFGHNSMTNDRHQLKITSLGTEREYDNRRYLENLITSNFINDLSYSFYYSPEIYTNLGFSSQNCTESLDYFSSSTEGINNRAINDQTCDISIGQALKRHNFNIYLNYDQRMSELEYRERYRRADGTLVNDVPADFNRTHSLFSASFEFQNAENVINSFGLQNINFNLTLENADDDLQPVSFNLSDTVSIDKSWSEASYQATLTLAKKNEGSPFVLNLTYGLSNTLPTPYQQICYLRYKPFDDERIMLKPEFKRNIEADLRLDKIFPEKKCSYNIELAAFTNLYNDKFREVRISNSPLIVFDNFSEAAIYGLEADGNATLFNQMLSLRSSIARYFLSDKVAFPFKSERKMTAGITGNYHGYSLDIFWFSESERIGWIKQRNGDTYLTELPAYANFDVHLTKNIKFWRFGGSIAFSIRNLLDRELALDGISLYERRYYVNFGIEI